MSTITYNNEYAKKLRTAFIGCGGHAVRNVYPAFQYAPVDLVAVCDLDLARAETCARQFGATRSYASHLQMLDKEKPDVVFIVTNCDENFRPRYPQLAVECMKAGAHAWIEKPPASSSEEIRGMMRISKETGKEVGVGFKKMFFPANQKAKEIIQKPSFGAITSITARYPQPLPELKDRRDAKKMISFLDHMVHPHSLLKYLAGDLESLLVRRNSTNASAMVSLRFKSGAIGNLHLCAGISGRSFLERTEIIGQDENVVVDNNIRVTYYRKDSVPGGYGRAGNVFEGELDHAPLFWEPEFSLGQLYNKGIFLLGYAPEVIHFTTRLLEKKGPEYGTLDDALELMKIYEAYLQADNEIVFV